MMGTVEKVSAFYAAHPKRQRALEKAISDTQPESSVQKLKDLCRTRWVQRLDALETFQTLHPSIVACIDTVCTEGPREWYIDSVTDARALLLAISTTDFLSALVITNACLAYLRALTSSLQAEAKDIVEATSEVSTVKASLQGIRDNIDRHHDDWYVYIICNVYPSYMCNCSI